jgi:hypothetical protein
VPATPTTEPTLAAPTRRANEAAGVHRGICRCGRYRPSLAGFDSVGRLVKRSSVSTSVEVLHAVHTRIAKLTRETPRLAGAERGDMAWQTRSRMSSF